MNGWLARVCITGSLTLLIASPSWGQKSSPPPGQPPPTPGGALPGPTNSGQPNASAMETPLYVHGRVIVEGGQPVPESVSVQLRCGIELVQAIHTDLKGNFQFILGAGPENNDIDVNASNDTPVVQGAAPPAQAESQLQPSGVGLSARQLWGCEVEVSVPGYQPLSKPITSDANVAGIDVGTLILTRIAGVHGAAVSVTSLSAPEKARKEFERGEKDARNRHLDLATKHLEKAVAEYDSYAAAWNELAQVYAMSHRTEEARQAFTRAIAADPQYIPPCVGLAELELQSGRYESAIDAAGKALRMFPGMAIASFIQAVANFRLNRLDAAEKSARDAENASLGNIPQLHLLLADISVRKGDYPNAAAQIQDYLKEAPEGAFAAEARKHLEEIERTASDVGGGPSGRDRKPQAPESQKSSIAPTGPVALKVCLRLEDDSSFVGLANVRMMPSDGREVGVTRTVFAGETFFSNMRPGTYAVEASAPGYLAVRTQADIGAGSRTQTLFLIMKPIPLPGGEAELSALPLAKTVAVNANPMAWRPPGIDSVVPAVEPGVACPLPQVMTGVGQRMKDLVQNLQKFDAIEHVEHFNVDATGSRGKPATRTFDYVVTVRLSNAGVFLLDEYRNGSLDPSQFPAQIATTGLPAMALIFHPTQISDFDLTCEGLGQWQGRPAWQVHFAQRLDRPNRIRAYVIGQRRYAIPLKGRVWIDVATYQVLRWESELMKPVPEIALTEEYLAIDYGPVQFQTRKQQIWLPLDAEVYSEWGNRRFYRRHAFSDFKLFEVESAQQIQSPKQSYCFKNANDQDIAGILTISPVVGTSVKAVSVRFTVPSGQSVCKIVGPNRDVSMPVDAVGSAIFTYNGPPGSITAEVNLAKESVLDLVPTTNAAPTP